MDLGPVVLDGLLKCLVGGFNPSEKYLSKWESSPNMGKTKNL